MIENLNKFCYYKKDGEKNVGEQILTFYYYILVLMLIALNLIICYNAPTSKVAVPRGWVLADGTQGV